MISMNRFLKNIGFALPVMVGVAHAEIPDNAQRFDWKQFGCLPVGKLGAYNDQFDVYAKIIPDRPTNPRVDGPAIFDGFVWTGLEAAKLNIRDPEVVRTFEAQIEKHFPQSKFPGIGTTQSIVVKRSVGESTAFDTIAVFDNKLLETPIPDDSPGGTVTVLFPYSEKLETFKCFLNRRVDYRVPENQSWVNRILLALETKNWRPSLLSSIKEDARFSIFSDMITKSGLDNYFDSLDAYDGLILPSNVGIRRQFENQIRKSLQNRALDPDALRGMVDRKVSELLESPKLQDIVLAQVVKKGYDIGAEFGRELEDGTGKRIQIGSGTTGANYGVTIDGDKNCDFDWNPIQTKQGIIYPTLCLRALR